MKHLKYGIPPLVIILILIMYFGPWLFTDYQVGSYDASLVILRLHSIATLIFAFSVFLLVGALVITLVFTVQKNPHKKMALVTFVCLLIFYVIIVIQMSKGYFIGGFMV